MSDPTIWQILGVRPTRDVREIRRAYARRLKSANPEDDPGRFKTLRSAFEQALLVAKSRRQRGGAAGPATTTEPAAAAGRQAAVSALVADERHNHEALCARLEQLAASGDSSDGEAANEALKAILTSRALDDVGIYARTEKWLASLVNSNTPRSDPWLAPLIARFNWDGVPIDRNDAARQMALSRQADLRFLEGLRDGRHPDRSALAALTRPPSGADHWLRLLTPGVPSKVRNLLAVIRIRRPSLLVDTDAQALRWWGEYLTRPALSPLAIWAVLVAPIVLGIVLGRASALRGLVVYLLSLVCLACLALTHLYGIVWPRRLWNERWAHGAPLWLRLGWAPSSLLLPIAAALLPPSSTATVGVAVTALAIGAWVAITGEPDRRKSGVPWPIRMIMRQAPLVAWWAFISSSFSKGALVQMSVALGAGIVACSLGAMSLLETEELTLREFNRYVPSIFLITLVIISGSFVSYSLRVPEIRQLAIVMVAVTALAQIPLSLTLRGNAFRIRYYFVYFSGMAIGFAAMGGRLDLVLVGAIWLLSIAGVTATIDVFTQLRRRMA